MTEKVEAKKDPTKEYPDPTPVEIPVEMQRAESMDEKLRRIINTELSQKMADLGVETIEEANDFDVKDDFEVDNPVSVHEMFDMEDEYPEQLVPPADPEKTKEEGEASPPSSEEAKIVPEAKEENTPAAGSADPE